MKTIRYHFRRLGCTRTDHFGIQRRIETRFESSTRRFTSSTFSATKLCRILLPAAGRAQINDDQCNILPILFTVGRSILQAERLSHFYCRSAAPQIIKVTVQPLRSPSCSGWMAVLAPAAAGAWLLWLLKRTARSPLPAEGSGKRRKNWIFHHRRSFSIVGQYNITEAFLFTSSAV